MKSEVLKRYREKLTIARLEQLAIIESKIGYTFKEKGFLSIALTHSSYVTENNMERVFCNERLEFIGDGFFNAIVGVFLFGNTDGEEEGVLSRKRSIVVRESSLAAVGKTLDLTHFILRSRGMEKPVAKAETAMVADAMEAIIGAVFLDGGFESAQRVVLALFQELIIKALNAEESRDYKSRLQEETAKLLDLHPVYKVAGERGPDHQKEFCMEVFVGKDKLGESWGNSKKLAAQEAAKMALKIIEERKAKL